MGDTTKKHNSDRRENILFPIPTITIVLVYLYLYYFYKKKRSSDKMNQNLDHASHVREHEKKHPMGRGKIFLFPHFDQRKKSVKNYIIIILAYLYLYYSYERT